MLSTAHPSRPKRLPRRCTGRREQLGLSLDFVSSLLTRDASTTCLALKTGSARSFCSSRGTHSTRRCGIPSACLATGPICSPWRSDSTQAVFVRRSSGRTCILGERRTGQRLANAGSVRLVSGIDRRERPGPSISAGATPLHGSSRPSTGTPPRPAAPSCGHLVHSITPVHCEAGQENASGRWLIDRAPW